MSISSKLCEINSKREIKKLMPLVKKIEALEEEYAALDNQALQKKTDEFKVLLNSGKTLDDILPDAFATVREASRRVLGLYHYPVQLLGGIILHQGRVAEMRTGEGKTLMETLPAYLNALEGKGVHIVTVNDYLAQRDSEQMGKIFRFLGLSVGLITHDIEERDERKAAYRADITYGTNNELGFDYLRDNMAFSADQQVMRKMNFAIVDEVDSILIDEARTPLIISGPGDEDDSVYKKVEGFVSMLEGVTVPEWNSRDELVEDIPYDYMVDEKGQTATLTDRGVAKAEEYFKIANLADPDHLALVHHINQSIRAHGLMLRDVNYIVDENGEIIIVDEHTGRLMYGRRFSDGLHQAIEAKEHVKINCENKTCATVTFQNFFRMYPKLSGMTGTAMTEETEFAEIYKLDIVEVPTNRPIIRVDQPDVVYKTSDAKYSAVVDMIRERHAAGQPVLIGTASIERNEYVSRLLENAGIPHNVLNAKNHEKEAYIIAQAGRMGAVTVATNMAGRGTDILLGGNPEYMAWQDMLQDGYSAQVLADATGFREDVAEDVLEAREKYKKYVGEHKKETDAEAEKVRAVGGLCVIGTERHDSRRVDNQLRGRAGRQGDPGMSQFFLSLEDDLLRLFGGEQLVTIMNRLDVPDDMPIHYKKLSGAIENAQITVESRNYETRKSVLQFDDVMNTQREVMYAQRQKILDGADVSGAIDCMFENSVLRLLNRWYSDDQSVLPVEEAKQMINEAIHSFFPRRVELRFSAEELGKMKKTDFYDVFMNAAMFLQNKLEDQVGEEEYGNIQRTVLLRTVDEYWVDQIDAMYILRKEIGLRGYGNKNPIDEYKREGFEMFEHMNDAIQDGVVFFMANLVVQTASSE